MKKNNKIFKSIVKIVGEDRVSDDRFERQMYGHDLAPLPKLLSIAFKLVPDIVVRPKNAKEVSKIINLARKEEIPITPRGAATWGLGGAVPSQGGILFDMSSMNQIVEVDEENLFVTAEAGISWKELMDTITKIKGSTYRNGYSIGSYPSSAPAATVGGWINTGGIGIGSYKYGGVENQLRSLEVVLSNGNIINTAFQKVLANASGYDLTRLFVGSEGTLGVITRATLKIHPKAEELLPLGYSFPDMENASKAMLSLTRESFVPLHICFFDKNHFEYLKELGLSNIDVGAMVNVTLEGSTTIVAEQEKIVDKVMFDHNGEKMDKTNAIHEWNERFYEVRMKKLGPTLVLYEIYLPIPKLYEALNKFSKFAEKRNLQTGITGVISDRNTVALMPYFLVDERKLIQFMTSLSTTQALSNIAFKLGGRPAGLGLFYAVNLPLMHGKASNVMDDIKSAIDPYGIMNPGKFVEGTTRFGVPIPGIGMKFGMGGMALYRRVVSTGKKKRKVNQKTNDLG